MIGPSRTPHRPSVAPRRSAPPADPPRREPPAAPARPAPRPRPDRPEAPQRAQGDERPRVDLPDVVPPAGRNPVGNGDVCSLGKRYGGWRPGSPEAVVCEQTYGR